MCLCYLDDIVFSKTFDDHHQRLQSVLKCIQDAGLVLNPKKCVCLVAGKSRSWGISECQRRKSVPQRPPGLLIPIPPASAPFQHIGIDLLGRFPRSTKGNKWIIIWISFRSHKSSTKAKFITEEYVLKQGARQTILIVAVFESKLVTELRQLCSSKHRKMTGYHPQTNGLTERFNKTLADMLSMYVGMEQTNWDEILPFVLFAYNIAKQENGLHSFLSSPWSRSRNHT
ncbi:transposon Ty3-I Gag-Pol polyprotein [Trichonephila inaurata madagascariensis]|uniref:Transposon Ty3-I Gag-Pol polyprotein n=1 Tax=Trichonephila inaurata madagascariensis TaxID=2747483 RepID=A0A8X6YSE4_9ARAC|nr:transposon Ty3-I Gag-Pol polyprotein [Trichonephila inaurata madagascariensis]